MEEEASREGPAVPGQLEGQVVPGKDDRLEEAPGCPFVRSLQGPHLP